jgi:hypothetical protein
MPTQQQREWHATSCAACARGNSPFRKTGQHSNLQRELRASPLTVGPCNQVGGLLSGIVQAWSLDLLQLDDNRRRANCTSMYCTTRSSRATPGILASCSLACIRKRSALHPRLPASTGSIRVVARTGMLPIRAGHSTNRVSSGACQHLRVLSHAARCCSGLVACHSAGCANSAQPCPLQTCIARGMRPQPVELPG